ncbi:MAG: hypothetical protein AB1846_06040 [Chloroflexota bacterium]
MELTPSSSKKLRDFAGGLFGWFLASNFLFGVMVFDFSRFSNTVSNILAYVTLGILWLATLALPPVLFAKGKHALGWGIVTAAVMNCGTWLVLMFGRDDVPFGLIPFLLPVPAALLMLFDD